MNHDILLDTPVLIWALENNQTLMENAVNAIVDGTNMVFVNSAPVWEISIKQQLGKLEAPDNLLEKSGCIDLPHFLLMGIMPNLQENYPISTKTHLIECL
jgi:hypothetical protein